MPDGSRDAGELLEMGDEGGDGRGRAGWVGEGVVELCSVLATHVFVYTCGIG